VSRVFAEHGPGTYDDCAPADKDEEGNTGASEDDTVLRPMSYFTDVLDTETTIVMGIVGVPPGYSGDITYADSDDATFQDNYGIGPGCAASSVTAIPPVRLRAFVESFGSNGSLHSICDDDYTAALSALADNIVARFEE
jgi:hypothetical protein